MRSLLCPCVCVCVCVYVCVSHIFLLLPVSPLTHHPALLPSRSRTSPILTYTVAPFFLTQYTFCSPSTHARRRTYKHCPEHTNTHIYIYIHTASSRILTYTVPLPSLSHPPPTHTLSLLLQDTLLAKQTETDHEQRKKKQAERELKALKSTLETRQAEIETKQTQIQDVNQEVRCLA